MPLSVLIYEDDDLLRENLSALVNLQPEWKLEAAFNSPKNVLAEIKAYQPDLILMDIDMPLTNGIEAVRSIRKNGNTLPIIMLTVFDDRQHVLDAICEGASGYLLKKHIPNKLYEAVNDVLSGGAPMSPTVARMVIQSMQKPAKENPYDLTPREQEVLRSLSRGNSYKMIADEFGVVIDTVRAHIKKIYDKLHVHSQTEAVAKALNEKLV